MALSHQSLASQILATTGFSGPQAAQMANGIALGITSYLISNPLNIVVTVGDVGSPGAGVGNGFILPSTCVVTVLYQLLQSNLSAAGLSGPQLPKLAFGLATSICAYLLSAQSITYHGGVGAGTTFGNFTGLTPEGFTVSILASTNFSGLQWPQMVKAISIALTTFLMTNVKLSIIITGPAGPGVATGAGSGRIL